MNEFTPKRFTEATFFAFVAIAVVDCLFSLPATWAEDNRNFGGLALACALGAAFGGIIFVSVGKPIWGMVVGAMLQAFVMVGFAPDIQS